MKGHHEARSQYSEPGRPKSSTAGPASNGKAMVAAALAVSLVPIARPRSNVRVASAMTAVAATVAADHPTPTRKVPVTMIQ